MVHATPEEEEHEEDADEDEEVVADLSREEDVTVKPLEYLAPPLPLRGTSVRQLLSHYTSLMCRYAPRLPTYTPLH
jgi:hypothetical protein